MPADKVSARGRPAGKGLPTGVTGPMPKGGKYQARVTYKPAGISQRPLGLFATPEEAAAAIAAALVALEAGSDPWDGQPMKKRKHKRGEVRSAPCRL